MGCIDCHFWLTINRVCHVSGCMFTLSLGYELTASTGKHSTTGSQIWMWVCVCVVHKPPREICSASDVGGRVCVCVCMHVQATDLRTERIVNMWDNPAPRLNLHWQRGGTAQDWTSKSDLNDAFRTVYPKLRSINCFSLFGSTETEQFELGRNQKSWLCSCVKTLVWLMRT